MRRACANTLRPSIAESPRLGVLLLGGALTACATATVPGNSLVPAALAECPSAPHCVSSLAADEDHKLAPITLAQPADKAWPAVIEAVRSSERTTIVQQDAYYLHAEIASPWHFYTDDLELMLGAGGRMDVRSSSRIGYYDFGVNRKRVEALREKLAAQGVTK